MGGGRTDVIFMHGKCFQHMSVPVHTLRIEGHYNQVSVR